MQAREPLAVDPGLLSDLERVVHPEVFRLATELANYIASSDGYHRSLDLKSETRWAVRFFKAEMELKQFVTTYESPVDPNVRVRAR